MPNPWTGKGNPYTRKEVVDRLRATLKKGQPIIAAGAGTGISAKFSERGGGGWNWILSDLKSLLETGKSLVD